MPYVVAEASEKDIAVFVTAEIRPYASVVITGIYFVLPYVPAEPTLANAIREFPLVTTKLPFEVHVGIVTDVD